MKCFVIVLGCGVFAAMAFSGDDTGRPVKPAVVWTGNDSKVEIEEFVRCVSEFGFREVWKKHRDDYPPSWSFCPKVDFESFMVVGVFTGKNSGWHGIEVKEIIDEKDCLRFRYWVVTVQPAPPGPNDKPSAPPPQHPVRDYVFAVVPQTTKAVVIEEGQYSRGLGQPLQFTERVKLPAIEAK
ncbi:MAG: hypothetical protein ACJ8C4_08570 [Gemmataceae bacterium]